MASPCPDREEVRKKYIKNSCANFPPTHRRTKATNIGWSMLTVTVLHISTMFEYSCCSAQKLLRSNGWPTSHLWRSIFFSVFVETAFATTLNWKSPIEFMYHRTINFRVVRDQMCSLIIILNTQCTRSKCGRGQIVAFRWFYGWWLGGWPLVFLYRTRNNHHRTLYVWCVCTMYGLDLILLFLRLE